MTESTLKKLKELRVAFIFGIIVLIIGIIAAIDQANSDVIESFSNNPQDCFSNQKLILKAIENYNSNRLQRIETALPGRDFEELEELLIKNWYLNNPIKLPTPECSYGYITENNKEIVFCKHHGLENTIIIPDYDRNKERPFSEKHIKYIESLKNARTQKESAIAYIRNLVDPTILIIFGLLFIVLVLDQMIRVRKRENLFD